MASFRLNEEGSKRPRLLPPLAVAPSLPTPRPNGGADSGRNPNALCRVIWVLATLKYLFSHPRCARYPKGLQRLRFRRYPCINYLTFACASQDKSV